MRANGISVPLSPRALAEYASASFARPPFYVSFLVTLYVPLDESFHLRSLFKNSSIPTEIPSSPQLQPAYGGGSIYPLALLPCPFPLPPSFPSTFPSISLFSPVEISSIPTEISISTGISSQSPQLQPAYGGASISPLVLLPCPFPRPPSFPSTFPLISLVLSGRDLLHPDRDLHLDLI